jgi:hypothetical protein
MSFKRTVIQVEVLHTDDINIPQFSMSEVLYQIDEGECSGEIKVISSDEITGKQMAKYAKAQGSDPDFFGIDEDGNPIED